MIKKHKKQSLPPGTDNLVVNFPKHKKDRLIAHAKLNQVGTAEFCRIILKDALDRNIIITRTITIGTLPK